MTFSLFSACHENRFHWNLFQLVVRMLELSGFKLSSSPYSFKILRWGFTHDFTVLALVYLWHACGSSGPAICRDVEEVAKTAYEIVTGERVSFYETYAKEKPAFTDFGCKGSILAEQMFCRIWTLSMAELNEMEKKALLAVNAIDSNR